MTTPGIRVARLQLLEVLDLDETQVTEAGLASVEAMPKLHSLSLRGTKVSEQCVEEISAARPQLEILR